MSRLNGKFREQDSLPSPSVTAVVEIPNLGVSASVEFLVDTGATQTVLHPGDVLKLGIDITTYAASAHPCISSGVGGEASYGVEDAILRFKNINAPLRALIGPLDPSQFEFALKKQIPSLLGRDFLNRGRLIVDYENNQVSIEMHPDNKIKQTNFMRSSRPYKEFLRYRQRIKRQGA